MVLEGTRLVGFSLLISFSFHLGSAMILFRICVEHSPRPVFGAFCVSVEAQSEGSHVCGDSIWLPAAYSVLYTSLLIL